MVGAMLAFSGCDTLDVADPNAPSPDAVSIQSLVSGVEGSMRADVNVYTQVTGIFGRELYFFEPADPRYTGELFTGPLDPGGFLLTRPWSSRYRTIRNAVTLLDRSGELSGADQAGVRGYAKAIIGYQLLLNLNYLDDNGIKIQFSEDVSTPFVTKAQGFAEIERYLNESLSDLGGAGNSFSFKLSSGFAGFDTPSTFMTFVRALQARVFLYQEKWQDALTAANASFMDPNGDMKMGVYHTYSNSSGDRQNPIFEVPTAPSVKLRAHPDIKANAEPGDLRYAEKVLDRAGDGTGFDPSPPAANGLSSNLVITLSKSSTDHYPIIRNEELVLIRAEANFHLGNMSAAQNDINAVRSAAGLGNVTISSSNGMAQILHERMYSLLGEGHRWIDVRRTGGLSQLPTDQVGTPAASGKIFDKWPRPIDEVPEN